MDATKLQKLQEGGGSTLGYSPVSDDWGCGTSLGQILFLNKNEIYTSKTWEPAEMAITCLTFDANSNCAVGLLVGDNMSNSKVKIYGHNGNKQLDDSDEISFDNSVTQIQYSNDGKYM